MTIRQQADRRPPPRFYLITPEIDDTARLAKPMTAALEAADVAAVLLRLAPAAERDLINRVKALAPVVQSTGAALILLDHADIAARAGADGAHLSELAAFSAAVATLKPARVAGCGGLKTRDEAMLAGERADYVMFGEPDPAGHRPSLPAIVERVEWWAELFTVPCVAFAASAEEIRPLAIAGADFIAYGETIWADPRGAGPALAEAALQIAASKSAT
jgi:thiamine-phosphate pyrophosphorylase